MKLLTELEDRMNGHGKRPVYNAGGIRPERAFAQDVMAAHALLQAIEAWGKHPGYQGGESWAKQRAAEILAGWLVEDQK